METALNAFFSLVFGVLLFGASPKALVGAAQAVRQTRVLRRQGLSRKVSLEMVPGAEVQVRYDPTTPSILALESGRRQGKAEIREAAIIFVLFLAFCLPTSIVMVGYAVGAVLP